MAPGYDLVSTWLEPQQGFLTSSRSCHSWEVMYGIAHLGQMEMSDWLKFAVQLEESAVGLPATFSGPTWEGPFLNPLKSIFPFDKQKNPITFCLQIQSNFIF